LTARHYVYALIDPRDLQPFYIGKGSLARRFSHFSKLSADLEKSGDKARRIAEIKAAGLRPEAVVLSWHDTDEAAYAAEQERIAAVGLGNLTNQNRGGGGDRSRATPSTQGKEDRLTAKQENFSTFVAGGANYSDAYRRAYDAGQSKPETVNRRAVALMRDSKIAARVAELRSKVADRVVVTVERQIENHKACFPVELPERGIRIVKGDTGVIFDPFGGSGTTMIAAEKNGRHSRLMEIDPKYCDVIVKRWCEFTGKDATLEANGKSFSVLEKRLEANAA
jgi:hypothetical protein